MGRRVLPDVVVASVATPVRGRSKPGRRHILWRPDLRRNCGAIRAIFLGTGAGGAGLCHGIHSLLAGSKCLSNVGPASARGGARPGNASKIYRSKMMRRLFIALVAALVSLSSLHAQSPTPARSEAPPKAIYTPKPAYRPEW